MGSSIVVISQRLPKFKSFPKIIVSTFFHKILEPEYFSESPESSQFFSMKSQLFFGRYRCDMRILKNFKKYSTPKRVFKLKISPKTTLWSLQWSIQKIGQLDLFCVHMELPIYFTFIYLFLFRAKNWIKTTKSTKSFQ